MKYILAMMLLCSSLVWCAEHKDTEYAQQLAHVPYCINNHYNITNAQTLMTFFGQAFGLPWSTFVANINHNDPSVKNLNKKRLINWRKIVQFLKDKYFKGLNAHIWYTCYFTLGDLIAPAANDNVPHFAFLDFLEEHLKQIDSLIASCTRASI